jgi:MFS family permease
MRRRPLFRNRDFLLLWGGETLSEVGSQSATVAYPLLVLALTGSATKAGIVGLARWLPVALFSLPAGVLADAVDRKRLMIACDVIRLIGAGSIVLALLIGEPAYLQIVVVAFVDGGSFATSFICERGALRQMVPADQVQDAVASNEARTYAAGIVGPSLGGLLFAAAQALPFIADAASYVCSMTAIAATRSPFQIETRRPSLRNARAEIAEGVGWLRSQPFYRTTSLLFAFGNPVYSGLYLLAILLARHHHASAAAIGVMLTITAIGGLLGAALAGTIRRNVGTRTLIVVSPWVVLVVILLLPLAHNALLIGVLVGAAEFLAPATNAVVAGSRIAAAPDHLQGRVQSVATTLAMSLVWLGPLAAGYLFEHGGTKTTVSVAAAWMLALALTTTLAPSLRKVPAGHV